MSKKKNTDAKNKTDVKYAITDRSSIFTPYERITMGMNSILRFAHLQRMKHTEINVDEKKIAVEGHRTIMAGDFHLDIQREDFRGSSVNFRAFNLVGLIIGSLISLFGIFGIIWYAADLFDNGGDTMPLGIGIISLMLGVLIIVLSCLKKTTITLRFVDKNSNSVRHFAIKVRRNAKEYYKTAKEFTERIWKE